MDTINKLLITLSLLTLPLVATAVEEPPPVHFQVDSFTVTGNNPLAESDTQTILQKFTGDHYGLEGLQSAAEALESAFRKNGYAFYRVTLIPQELKDGNITLSISEFTVANINIEGNEFFNEENIRRNAPGLETGSTPNTAELSRAINMANAQPSKHIKLQFTESESGGAIDANLIVEDKHPDFFFVALNNTGTDDTGNFRLTGGYQSSNLFNADHILSASYTTAPDDSSAVSQYGLSYKVPFYATGSSFSFLFSKSDVDSGIVANQFNVSGAGNVISLRYNHIFLQSGSYKQDIDIGLDNKAFENDVTFFGFPVTGSGEVLSRPISFTYRGSYLTTSSNLTFSIGLASNISGGSKNDDTDYNAIRTGAAADWSKINYSAAYTGFLGDDWLWRGAFSGQETSDPLIPGEQFGVGGMSSVRGFEERSILGDTGYQANLELWFPAITEYKIRTLVFYDLGNVSVINQSLGLPASQDLASIGAGMRWSWQEQLSALLDFGYVLTGAGTVADGDSRAHLDVFYRF